MEVAGYGPFPRETFVSISLAGLFMNEKYFPNPRKFDPNRFLEDGKLKPNRSFIPFSVGARRCPGEHLAMQEQYIFIVSILQNFKLSNTEILGEELTEKEWLDLWNVEGHKAKDGHFLMLKNQKFIASKRM